MMNAPCLGFTGPCKMLGLVYSVCSRHGCEKFCASVSWASHLSCHLDMPPSVRASACFLVIVTS